MLELKPAVVASWRKHFQRHPPDALERLLSLSIIIQCAEPRPLDCEIRPWAYTPQEAARLREQAQEVWEGELQDKRDRQLTAFMRA